MEDRGYECGKCGYTPDDRELQNGICPRCKPPPPPRVEVALMRTNNAISEAVGHLYSPEAEPESVDAVTLNTFIERLDIIGKDLYAEIQKRKEAKNAKTN